LHFKTCADGLVPRRGPAFTTAFLRQARRLVLAVRVPWLGERRLVLPPWGA
jgi:hypothetical protein